MAACCTQRAHSRDRLIEGQLHDELAASPRVAMYTLGFKGYLNIIALLDVVGDDLPGPTASTRTVFGPSVYNCSDTLQVQDNLGNIFLDALNGGELVNHAVPIWRWSRRHRAEGKKHTTQAVADVMPSTLRGSATNLPCAVRETGLPFRFYRTFNLILSMPLVKPMCHQPHCQILSKKECENRPSTRKARPS